MLGVDYQSSTYVHFVETIYCHEQPDLDWMFGSLRLNRPLLGEFWDRSNKLSMGRMGDADCRLFRISEYVDTLLREVMDNPDPYWA